MEYKYLPDLCENLDYQRKPITEKDRVAGTIPYYGASGIVDYVENYIFDEDLLLVSEDGANLLMRSTPIAFSISGKAWVNNHAHVLRFLDKRVQRYVEIYLNSISLEPYVTGSAQPKLNQKRLNEIPIPILKREEITKVIDSVNQVERLISLRKQQLAKLDELVKSRFVELFGDYRINEKGFDCKKGNELFKFSSGKFLPEEQRLSDGIPVYGGNGIAWYTNECLINYPTIIIGRVGAQCGNIHAVTTPVWITDNAIYIKEQKTEAYTLEFLTELMRMMDFYQYADFSGQPKITQKPLETLDYIIPPIELQNEYTAFVEQTDKSKDEIQKSLEKLETLKKALMQEYFG